MNDVAQAMQLLSLEEVREIHKDIMLAHREDGGDRKKMLMKQSSEVIISTARRHATEMETKEVAETLQDLEARA